MLEKKIPFDSRDLDKQHLTEAELDLLIGDRDYEEFLNTRAELYRERNMKQHPALSLRIHQANGQKPQSHPTSAPHPRLTNPPRVRRNRVPQAREAIGVYVGTAIRLPAEDFA